MANRIDHRKLWVLLGHPIFAIILFLILALLLYGYYLTAGFYLDDILLINAFEKTPLSFPLWGGVWSPLSGGEFAAVWWRDQGLQLGFWRPIPSLFFQGSLLLFGRNPFPLHLASILIHWGVASFLYLLVRKVSNNPILALLSGLVFVTCEDHSWGIGWISTITDLLCVFFVMLSFLSHLEWLKRRRPIFLTGSILAMVLALACKESAVIAPFGLVLMSFFLPKGVDEELSGQGSLGRRLKIFLKDTLAWLPGISLVVIYICSYKLIPLGGMRNLLYFDPFSNPGGYLSHLIIHLPVMWLGAFTLVPLDMGMLIPGLYSIFAAIGVVLFTFWIFALLPFRKSGLVMWAFTFFVISLLPQVCVDASSRGLYLPMVPGAILVAVLVSTIGPIARRMGSPIAMAGRWTKFIGWSALVGLLAIGTLYTAIEPHFIIPGMELPEVELRTAVPIIEETHPEYIVILNTNGFLLTLYTSDFIKYFTGENYIVRTLSCAYGVFTVEREGRRVLTIRTDRPGWLSNFMARVLRVDPFFATGEIYSEDLFTATILETTEDRRDVMAVKFDFNRPLDDPSVLFLKWDGDSFKRLNVSMLPIGEAVLLGDTSDMFAGP